MRSITTMLVALLLAGVLMSCQRERFDLDAVTVEVYRARIVAVRGATTQPGDVTAVVGVDTAVLTVPSTQPQTTQPGLELPATAGLVNRQPAAIVELSLPEAIHRAIKNSLDIKVESYSPGIAAADIVAAEAAFDTVFFSEYTRTNLDQPVNSTSLIAGGGQTDQQQFNAGFRKRLATGAQIQARYAIDRTDTQQPFLRYNPFYDSDASLELRQPLLKNFGVAVNRAQIYVNRNRRDISMYQFRRQVIQTLADVEQGYWTLYYARQSLAVQRMLLEQTVRTLDQVKARRDLDALPVNVSQSESAVARRRADVIRLEADVKDAEDRLKNLLNDPALPVSRDIAIVPTTQPLTMPVPLNPEVEIWAALENRSELQEARLNIANANIVTGVAKNQLLPQLDLLVQWNVNGLRGDWGDSTEQVLAGDFQDTVVGLTFEFPLGNRAAEAELRKSRLQRDQAVTNYHNIAAEVLTQIQIALRNVRTSFDEILANQQAVTAARENLDSLVARRERLSPEYLDLELKTQESLAIAARALWQAIANYNIAIVQLEQAKGTLLRYERVELAPEPVIVPRR